MGLAGAAVGASRRRPPRRTRNAPRAAPRVVMVTTARILRSTAQCGILPGTIAARTELDLAFRVGGKLLDPQLYRSATARQPPATSSPRSTRPTCRLQLEAAEAEHAAAGIALDKAEINLVRVGCAQNSRDGRAARPPTWRRSRSKRRGRGWCRRSATRSPRATCCLRDAARRRRRGGDRARWPRRVRCSRLVSRSRGSPAPATARRWWRSPRRCWLELGRGARSGRRAVVLSCAGSFRRGCASCRPWRTAPRAPSRRAMRWTRRKPAPRSE